MNELPAIAGLEEKARARIRDLSGGQQRRLDLALAPAGDPGLVFLDEPATGFDPSARRGAWELIRALASGAPQSLGADHATVVRLRLPVRRAHRPVCLGWAG